MFFGNQTKSVICYDFVEEARDCKSLKSFKSKMSYFSLVKIPWLTNRRSFYKGLSLGIMYILFVT